MSELPVEFEINLDRPINIEPLRAALAEIEAYTEELANDEPEEEGEA
jgi:hypothetical protein